MLEFDWLCQHSGRRNENLAHLTRRIFPSLPPPPFPRACARGKIRMACETRCGHEGREHPTKVKLPPPPPTYAVIGKGLGTRLCPYFIYLPYRKKCKTFHGIHTNSKCGFPILEFHLGMCFRDLTHGTPLWNSTCPLASMSRTPDIHVE